MAALHGEHILVVEDEAKLARLMKQLLEAFGFKVQTAGSGAEALTYATQERPDLVTLDLRLPDQDGFTVCRQLRQLYHSSVLPVVMVTAMDQPIDHLRGMASGADAYLTKPYDSSELIQTIVTLLEQTATT